MKTVFSVGVVLFAGFGLAQDIKRLSPGFYLATQDPRSLPKLHQQSHADQLTFSGSVVVISGSNATFYMFAHGKRLLFVTEDKVYENPKSSFAAFLKGLPKGADLRMNAPEAMRLSLPADANKLANFTGTVVKNEYAGICQFMIFDHGKIVSSFVGNTQIVTAAGKGILIDGKAGPNKHYPIGFRLP